MLRHYVANVIRSSHARAWARTVARGCEKYLTAYYNQGFWDMERNGEGWLIRQLSRHVGPTAIRAVDVGAHEGGWASEFLALCPHGHVTCFEIVPGIRESLGRRFSSDPRVVIAPCGLSDKPGHVAVTWNKSFNTTNAICPTSDAYFYRGAETILGPRLIKSTRRWRPRGIRKRGSSWRACHSELRYAGSL